MCIFVVASEVCNKGAVSHEFLPTVWYVDSHSPIESFLVTAQYARIRKISNIIWHVFDPHECIFVSGARYDALPPL